MKYLLVLFLLFQQEAYSTDVVDHMEMDGFSAYKNKKTLNEKKWGERVQHTYDVMVRFGVFRLKKAKYLPAEQLLKEWTTQYSKEFIYDEINADLVEDHAPAIQWLDSFYQTLVKTIGQKSVDSLRLNDIDLLNRSIVTTFHPTGTEHDDYKDCFVRGTVEPAGYWSVLAACSIYQTWIGTNPTISICTPLSVAARTAFGIVGKPISESIWKNANTR